MKRTPLTFAFCVALTAGAAQADDCPDLGLSSEFLGTYFCGLFDEIISSNTTRELPGEGEALPEGPGFEWLENDLMRDAYRVDPKKTLELIQRIREAGGLPES